MHSKSPRIVLVDDEEELVWSLDRHLAKLRPEFLVRTAHNGIDALDLLTEAPTQLLVADIRMPGMSGLELILLARRRWPKLAVIAMTAYPTPDVHREVASSALTFVQKPFGTQRFLEAIDDALVSRSDPRGFNGPISLQTLAEIVQLYSLSQSTGILHVERGDDKGTVAFDRGSVTHVETHHRRGVEAFFEIVDWSGGDFWFEANGRLPMRTIERTCTELLLEAMRRKDEGARHPACASSSWTLSPPPTPGALEAIVVAPRPIVPSFLAANAVVKSRALQAVAADLDEELLHAERMLDDWYTAKADELQRAEPTRFAGFARLRDDDGFVGAALVDSETGALLAEEGGGPIDMTVAAACNAEVVQAKRRTMAALRLDDDIEDILVSLDAQYHLIRPLRSSPKLFVYVVLDRARANLAVARMQLAEVTASLCAPDAQTVEPLATLVRTASRRPTLRSATSHAEREARRERPNGSSVVDVDCREPLVVLEG